MATITITKSLHDTVTGCNLISLVNTSTFEFNCVKDEPSDIVTVTVSDGIDSFQFYPLNTTGDSYFIDLTDIFKSFLGLPPKLGYPSPFPTVATNYSFPNLSKTLTVTIECIGSTTTADEETIVVCYGYNFVDRSFNNKAWLRDIYEYGASDKQYIHAAGFIFFYHNDSGGTFDIQIGDATLTDILIYQGWNGLFIPQSEIDIMPIGVSVDFMVDTTTINMQVERCEQKAFSIVYLHNDGNYHQLAADLINEGTDAKDAGEIELYNQGDYSASLGFTNKISRSYFAELNDDDQHLQSVMQLNYSPMVQVGNRRYTVSSAPKSRNTCKGNPKRVVIELKSTENAIKY